MSSSFTQRLTELVQQLTRGWDEPHVEHAVIINGATELRARTVRHPGLLAQLDAASKHQNTPTAGPATRARPGSRPPGNMAAFTLLDDISRQARDLLREMRAELGRTPTQEHWGSTTAALTGLIPACLALEPHRPETARYAVRETRCWVRRARVVLGHEKPTSVLRDTVCGECGGALVVAADATTDVRCIGTPDTLSCGTVYERWRWLELAADMAS